MLRRAVLTTATRLLGATPTIRRIPFGPARGRRLCIAPQISMRMLLGLDEPWAMAMARRYLHPGGVAYDLGAHVGYTALVMAQAVAPDGVVHAFEIHPETTALLRKTVAANPSLPIHIHPVGVADRRGEITLQVGPTAMADFRRQDPGAVCQVVALDEYLVEAGLPVPRVMKIDVEGAEIDCLRGARGLIADTHPVLLIEFHSRHRLESGLAMLRDLGYQHFTSPSPLEGADHFHDTVLCTS